MLDVFNYDIRDTEKIEKDVSMFSSLNFDENKLRYLIKKLYYEKKYWFKCSKVYNYDGYIDNCEYIDEELIHYFKFVVRNNIPRKYCGWNHYKRFINLSCMKRYLKINTNTKEGIRDWMNSEDHFRKLYYFDCYKEFTTYLYKNPINKVLMKYKWKSDDYSHH